ncbi:hypothetical protein GBAR_LOCUS16561 [Geodia barretti]|uniref:Transmembrane protein n=1 Tax=Geodia barretti TaxID=519541 RepID=A0AA35SHB2_GEOBA|nr:hypothetical protein GBAR_LOCUS16561 [Geodia barretti]
MFATNYFLVSFILIHHISVVPVLSSCPESFTATNVSALGLTVSPVYTGSSDCDCKCAVGVDSNGSLSTGSGTCSESTAENTTLGFLIAITVTNAILLVALIVIVVLYGVIAFRNKYGWVKSSVKQSNTNINDAYGILDCKSLVHKNIRFEKERVFAFSLICLYTY